MSTIDMIDELDALEADLAALAAKRDAIKAERRLDAIANVKGIMAAHGLTVADLSGKVGHVLTTKSTDAYLYPRGGKKAEIKYRDDKGNTWTGRGLAPRWIIDAWRADKSADGGPRVYAERFRIGCA